MRARRKERENEKLEEKKEGRKGGWEGKQEGEWEGDKSIRKKVMEGRETIGTDEVRRGGEVTRKKKQVIRKYLRAR